MSEKEKPLVSEELHNALHGALKERVENLEEQFTSLTKPEDGILAKMKASLEQVVEERSKKLEAKFNWIIGAVLTGAAGTVLKIILNSVGLSN